MSRIVFLSVLLLFLLLATGCVGLAVSVPYSSITTQNISTPVDFSAEDYLPREAKSGETATKDVARKLVTYESIGDNCYFQIIVIPLLSGDCQSRETWTYIDSKTVTIDQHSHHLFGFYCSPIPFVSSITTADAGTQGYRAIDLIFCSFHIGSKLNEHRLL